MADERTYGFNRDDAEAVLEGIGQKAATVPEVRPRGSQVRRQVIMKDDLFAAVATKTDPSVADAYLLEKRGDNLVNTGDTIEITNRFENISVDAGTYAKAEWIDGEWQLYAADCPGGSESSGSIDTHPGGEGPEPEPEGEGL
jgi:hypothetical protein